MKINFLLIFPIFILSLSLASACLDQDLNFSSISLNLSQQGIQNNLNQVTCANVQSFPDLYFENLTYGKISFLSPINISSQQTQDFLYNLSSKLNFSSGSIFLQVQNTIFQEEPVLLSFYNLKSLFPSYNLSNTTTSENISSNLVAVDEYSDPLNSQEVFALETANYDFNQDIFSIESYQSFETYLDFFNPSINLVYPQDNSLIGPNSIPFSYNVTDLKKLNCSLSITPTVQIPQSWQLNDSEFFSPSQINVSIPTNMEDGDYFWSVTCTDYSGKSTTTQENSFAFDPIKPFVDFVDSDYYIYTSNSNTQQQISIAFSELISNTPTISVDLETQTVSDCSSIDDDFSTFCFTYTVPELFQGQANISVSQAQDLAGNLMDTNTEHSISIDTLPPSVSFDSTYTISSWNENALEISGGCSLEFQNEYYLSFTGHNESLLCDTLDEVDGFWITTLNLSNLSDGDINLTLSGLDEPGNSISLTETAFKDSTPPAFFNYSQIIYAEATSEFGANVTFDNLTAIDAFEGPVEVLCDAFSGDIYELGNTTVYCQALDSLDNLAEVEFNISVRDTTPPAISFSGITGIINVSEVQLEFSLYENVSNPVACSYTLDKTTTDIVPCNNINSISITNISDGVHKIRVSAQDNISNTQRTRFYTFFINTNNKSVVLPFSSSLFLNETLESIILEDNYSLTNITISNSINFQDNISLDLSLFSSQNSTSTSIILENNLTIFKQTNSTNITLFLPANITLVGPGDWDNSFLTPSARNISSVNPTAITGSRVTATNSVFEIGIPEQKIYSDKAIRILFQGQANKSVGFQRNNTFTRISTICSSDNQSVQNSISPESDCYINIGNDLIVYTKHLTLFATYTQTIIPTDTTPRPRKSGGGGGGGGAVIPKKNITTNSLNATNVSNTPIAESPKQENQQNNQEQTKQESKVKKLFSRITGRVSEVVSNTTTGAVSIIENPLVLVILAVSAFLFISWAFIRWHRNIMLTYFNTPQDPRDYKY